MKLGLNRSLATSNNGVLTNEQQIANNFEARVVEDGNFESKSCLVAQLTILSNI